MTDAAFWWVNTVTVQHYLGQKSSGAAYGPPLTVDCWVEDDSILVRDTGGTEIVSTTSVFAPLSAAPLFTAGSLVTVAGSNRPAEVISVARFDSGSLHIGLDHIRVHLR